MEQTWKPTAAGICALIAGIGALIIGLVSVAFVGIFAGLPFIGMFGAVSAPFIILGIIAIIGGIYALKRRIWWLALVGSICALFPGIILGVLAIIFVIMGKGEFK